MNFDLYKTFYYVGKCGSITSAAKALYVTQPSVSHAIQTLERELDCRLLIRSQKGVEFTPEGKQFYLSVAKACETIFKAEQKLEASKNLSEGLITIGASETTLHHFLMPYLADFRKNYPNIRLKLFNSSTPQMLHSLLNGTIDFAVLILDRNYRHEMLSVTHLSDFQDYMIAGNEFSCLKEVSISLKELLNYPLVSMEKGTLTRNFFDQVFESHGLDPEPDIELATTDLIVPVVAAGLGIGMVPEPFSREALSQGTIFRLNIKERIPRREICLIKKKKAPLSLPGNAFIKCLLSDNR